MAHSLAREDDVCGRRAVPELGGVAAGPAGTCVVSPGAAARPVSRGATLVHEAPLTRLTVGMWSSRRHRCCQLLLLPQQQQLVVLCDRRTTHAPGSPSRFSLATAAVGLTAKSPFATGHSAYRASGCVHVFEVPFHSVRGIDYSNPLCHEARLVLETVGLCKREFGTMEAAREFFLGTSAQLLSSPSTPEDAALPGGGSRAGTGGTSLLQAALQSQPAATAVATGATAQAPALGAAAASAGDAGGGKPGARRSSCDVSSSGGKIRGYRASWDGGSSGARGSLLPRLNAGGQYGGAGSLAPVPSQPLPIDMPSAAAAAAASAAGYVDASALPAASRSSLDSFDDEESDPGSPASGSLWYWGSPAASRSYFSAADSGGSQGAAAAGGGSPSSRSSWEDLGRGAAAGSASLAAAERQASRPGQQQQQQQHTTLHEESSPSPILLSSSMPRQHPPWQQAGAGSGLQRVASEGQLLAARSSSGGGSGGLGEQRQSGGSGGVGEQRQSGGSGGLADQRQSEAGWPAAHAFTTVSRVYRYRTVVLNWTDQRLPGMLRPIIQGNERLLRLHESGLPAWAVYAPQYGLFYRPWLRTITWLLFYAFSVFSFAVGFYDLYKVVPGLQVVMHRLMASVWLPPAAVLEWLEQHTQIRLSILLTYLFGQSKAFVWFMRWVQHFARIARAMLEPVSDMLGPPLAMLGQALSAAGLTVASILQAGLAPVAALLLQCGALLAAALLPVAQLLQGLVTGPLVLLGGGLRQIGAASAAVWGVCVEVGAGAVAGVAALAGTAKAGRAVGGATSQAIAGQAFWLYIIPADAYEVLRTSAVKVAKAAQAVAKFFLQICDNVVRHRLTLGLRAQRAWRRIQRWLTAATMAPHRLAATLLAWLIAVFHRLRDWCWPAGLVPAHGEVQGEDGPSGGQLPQLQLGQQLGQLAGEERDFAGSSAASPTHDVSPSGSPADGLRYRTAAATGGSEVQWSEPVQTVPPAVVHAASDRAKAE